MQLAVRAVLVLALSAGSTGCRSESEPPFVPPTLTVVPREPRPPAAVRLTYRLAPARAGAIGKRYVNEALAVVLQRLDRLGFDMRDRYRRTGDDISVDLPALAPDELARVKTELARRFRVELKLVEHDSPLMKALAARAGAGGTSGAPVVGEEDTWTTDDGTPLRDHYLTTSAASGRTVLERFIADAAAADPTLRVEDEHEIGFQSMPVPGPPRWRSYLLRRETGVVLEHISDAFTRRGRPSSGFRLLPGADTTHG